MIRVLEVIYGFGYGGIRAFIMNYLNYLDKSKFKVDIYVFGYDSSPFTDKVKASQTLCQDLPCGRFRPAYL